jgi:hypothetical protein
MIIGDVALIPEDIKHAFIEWIPQGVYRFTIVKSNDTQLEQFTVKKDDSDKWLRLAEKAISQSADIRSKMYDVWDDIAEE